MIKKKRLLCIFAILILVLITASCGESAVNAVAETPQTTVLPTSAPSPSETALPTPTATPMPLPVITKHPYGETVEAGGGTWFISTADGAERMNWYFSPSSSDESYSVDDTIALLPNLELEILDNGTIALRNIPNEMNGWTVYAEFYNDGGSVQSERATIEVYDLLELYAPAIKNMTDVVNAFQAGNHDCDDPYSLFNMFGFRTYEDIGYTFIDIDGNGVKELLYLYGSDSSSSLCAVFGLENGVPVLIARSGGRYVLCLTEQNYLFQGDGGWRQCRSNICPLQS